MYKPIIIINAPSHSSQGSGYLTPVIKKGKKCCPTTFGVMCGQDHPFLSREKKMPRRYTEWKVRY